MKFRNIADSFVSKRKERRDLEKVQETLEVGAAALKNRSLKLTKKFRDWKNGSWRRMKRSNIESKRTKKKGKPVLVNKSLNSKERKWR